MMTVGLYLLWLVYLTHFSYKCILSFMHMSTSTLNDNRGQKLTSTEVIQYNFNCGENLPLDPHNEVIYPSSLLCLSV